MEYLQILLIVVVWFVLQKWILPKMGVSTWMEPNACRVPADKKKKKELPVRDETRSDQESP